MSMLENLKEYFKNTSREQVLKDWEETNQAGSVGVPVSEFLKQQKDVEEYIEWVRNNFHKDVDENHWDGE